MRMLSSQRPLGVLACKTSQYSQSISGNYDLEHRIFGLECSRFILLLEYIIILIRLYYYCYTSIGLHHIRVFEKTNTGSSQRGQRAT